MRTRRQLFRDLACAGLIAAGLRGAQVDLDELPRARETVVVDFSKWCEAFEAGLTEVYNMNLIKVKQYDEATQAT